MFSRLPLSDTLEDVLIPGETVLLLNTLNLLPVTADQIKYWTNNDPVLCKTCKMFTRNFVWWPQMDKELEDIVKTCDACQHFRHLPLVAPLRPWEWPQKP